MTTETATVQLVAINRLKPAEWNPRLIKSERFKTLCQSIQADPDFLWRRPVLALADGTIYAGNLRFRAAQHLGWTEIPAILDDVPEQLAKERALRDNNQWGEWQEDDLSALVYELKDAGSDLELLGFEPKELDRLLSLSGANGEEEAEGGVQDVPSKYMVIVECPDEQSQADLLGRLTSEGWQCRALLS